MFIVLTISDIRTSARNKSIEEIELDDIIDRDMYIKHDNVVLYMDNEFKVLKVRRDSKNENLMFGIHEFNKFLVNHEIKAEVIKRYVPKELSSFECVLISACAENKYREIFSR